MMFDAFNDGRMMLIVLQVSTAGVTGELSVVTDPCGGCAETPANSAKLCWRWITSHNHAVIADTVRGILKTFSRRRDTPYN
eukprot:4160976-Pyramimonas_sp.AAC.1